MSAPSLESVIAEFIERSESGDAPDAHEFLHRYPDHADELAAFFRNQDWLGAAEPPPPADLAGKSLGPYRIDSEIARGGMGVVYRAVQQDLGRVVALKVINNGWLAGDEERRRFRVEAEAAASMDHPSIVPIYSIGCDQGHDYFAMRLIEGPTLQSWIDSGRDDPRRAAEIVRDLALAVEYAHRRGVIHRDLKPENVLMDCSSPGCDGRPMLTDFGLARWRHARDASMTRTGQVLGTPHYMSPQQAAGVVAIDSRADGYSLGAILYALLSGRPPHAGDSTAEVLRSVLQDEPPPLRSVARGVPACLERVCHRALAFAPESRYPRAGDLAEDLQRFLDDEPVQAGTGSIVRRVVEEIDRDRHQAQFVDWYSALWQIGIIIAVAHIAIFFLRGFDQPDSAAFWGPRVIMLVAIAARILVARRGALVPRTTAERPVWSIWMGYLTALAAVNVLALGGVVDPESLFPLASVLSAFGFIAMAGHAWGASGILGLGFVLVSIACAILPATAPLWFGGMWAASLGILAWHYRRARALAGRR